MIPNIRQIAEAVADMITERLARDIEARIMAKLEPRLQALSARILTQSGVVAEHHAHAMREEILAGTGPTPEQRRARRSARQWGLDSRAPRVPVEPATGSGEASP